MAEHIPVTLEPKYVVEGLRRMADAINDCANRIEDEAKGIEVRSRIATNKPPTVGEGQ